MTSFHETLVQQCGSDTVTLLVGTLETIWVTRVRDWVEDASARHNFYKRAEKLEAVECHEAICDLIEAGDDFRVSQVMTEHLKLDSVYGNRIDASEKIDAASIRRER